MINLSQKAEEVLKDYFKDKEITPIRIFLQTGGCSGQSLAMALDEPKATDDVCEINGFTMLIDKELHGTTKDITVDYVTGSMGSGFQLASEIPVGGGGGCCGSCSCG
ncbi:MAG: IscA/HesB family protein [Syntrophobacteraceae bacterium]